MKRDDKLFSIGEIAKALGVTRRIILHYEERGLIEPDKRDDATNNRYYTIDTFTKLRSIRSLQNLGLTLDEIRDYYNDSTDLMPLIRRMEEMRDQLNLKAVRAGQGILRSGQGAGAAAAAHIPPHLPQR